MTSDQSYSIMSREELIRELENKQRVIDCVNEAIDRMRKIEPCRLCGRAPEQKIECTEERCQ